MRRQLSLQTSTGGEKIKINIFLFLSFNLKHQTNDAHCTFLKKVQCAKEKSFFFCKLHHFFRASQKKSTVPIHFYIPISIHRGRARPVPICRATDQCYKIIYRFNQKKKKKPIFCHEKMWNLESLYINNLSHNYESSMSRLVILPPHVSIIIRHTDVPLLEL